MRLNINNLSAGHKQAKEIYYEQEMERIDTVSGCEGMGLIAGDWVSIAGD
jgi:hypothetical protein